MLKIDTCFNIFIILCICAGFGQCFISYARSGMPNKRCGMGREFLIIPTSSQNDITLPQLNASIAGHKSGVARLHYTAVKGVKCPEMMLTMATKATLQSYHVSAAIKFTGFSMHLWKRALTEDLRIFYACINTFAAGDFNTRPVAEFRAQFTKMLQSSGIKMKMTKIVS